MDDITDLHDIRPVQTINTINPVHALLSGQDDTVGYPQEPSKMRVSTMIDNYRSAFCSPLRLEGPFELSDKLRDVLVSA
jgi:hypothetical protein